MGDERLSDDELDILLSMVRMGEKVRWESVIAAIDELVELRARVARWKRDALHAVRADIHEDVVGLECWDLARDIVEGDE